MVLGVLPGLGLSAKAETLRSTAKAKIASLVMISPGPSQARPTNLTHEVYRKCHYSVEFKRGTDLQVPMRSFARTASRSHPCHGVRRGELEGMAASVPLPTLRAVGR